MVRNACSQGHILPFAAPTKCNQTDVQHLQQPVALLFGGSRSPTASEGRLACRLDFSWCNGFLPATAHALATEQAPSQCIQLCEDSGHFQGTACFATERGQVIRRSSSSRYPIGFFHAVPLFFFKPLLFVPTIRYYMCTCTHITHEFGGFLL